MKRIAPVLLGVLAVAAIVTGLVLNTRGTPGKVEMTRPPFELSQLKGEIGIVNIWATWCAPCRREIPTLLELTRQYEAKGVKFVAVNDDNGDPAMVDAFVKTRAPSLGDHLAYPADGFIDGIKLQALPTTLVVDRQGNVVKRFVGELKPEDVTALRAVLDQSLAAAH